MKIYLCETLYIAFYNVLVHEATITITIKKIITTKLMSERLATTYIQYYYKQQTKLKLIRTDRKDATFFTVTCVSYNESLRFIR